MWIERSKKAKKMAKSFYFWQSIFEKGQIRIGRERLREILTHKKVLKIEGSHNKLQEESERELHFRSHKVCPYHLATF